MAHVNDFPPNTTAGTPAGFLTSLKRRLIEMGAVVLWVFAFMLSLSLWSYNSADPSFNTSASHVPTNLLGAPGALIADILLQGLGLSSWLFVVIMLSWGWNILCHRGLRPFSLRFIASLCLILLFATVLAGLTQMLPWLFDWAWPTQTGLGGTIGQIFLQQIDYLTQKTENYWIGKALIAFCAFCGALLLTLSMGLTQREWRALRWLTFSIILLPYHIMQFRKRKSCTVPRKAKKTHDYYVPTGYKEPNDLPFVSKAESINISNHKFEDEEPDISATAVRRSPESLNVSTSPLVFSSLDSHNIIQASEKEKIENDNFSSSPHNRKGVLGHLWPLSGNTRQNKELAATDLPFQDNMGLTQNWQLPPIELLHIPTPHHSTGLPRETLETNARLLETILSDYGVKGSIGHILTGPVVTLYELKPEAGVRATRVIGLADDIARCMSVVSVRIATVPGRTVIGIEIPNGTRDMVYFSELINNNQWKNNSQGLVLCLGKNILGEPVYADLSKMPHLLIAGTTGSGKSVGVNAMILSLLYQKAPHECRLLMIDPKMLELSIYNGIPHLLTPVVTEPQKAVTALKWVVREMERRYRAMSQLNVRNMWGYNNRIKEARKNGEIITRSIQTGFDPETGKPLLDDKKLDLEIFPYIIVIIDEMADLMMVAGKEIEACVQRLAQMARAAGIHVVTATQRPSVDVITGTIKANFPTRISFQVISKIDSRTILGEQGAEQLLGQGDMLYLQGGGRITRIHGPFVADREVDAVVNFLRSQGEPVYAEGILEEENDDNPTLSRDSTGGVDDELYNEAISLIMREKRVSISLVQRGLRIGYNRAATLVERMEKDRIVSSPDRTGKRELLDNHIT